MSAFNVNSITNNVKDADDPPNLKANGTFEVHYQTPLVADGSLGYEASAQNLGTMVSLNIWAERNGNKKKSKLTLTPNDSNFAKSYSNPTKVWTVTYTAPSGQGISRAQGDDPQNIQVVVGSDGQ